MKAALSRLGSVAVSPYARLEKWVIVAFVLFVIASVSAVFAFGGAAGTTHSVATAVFNVAAVLFALTLEHRRSRR